MPVPAIAIHGSGPRGEIARTVDSNFRGSKLYDRVETFEFDWDRVVPADRHHGVKNLYRFLRQHAANIGAAASMGLEFGAHYADAMVGGMQVRLYRLLQWLVAGLVATLVAVALAEVVVLAPAAWYGLPTVTFAPVRWMDNAVTWMKFGIIVGVTALIWLGLLRIMLTMSTRSGIITFRSVVLLAAQPVMIIGLAILAADWWLVLVGFGTLGLSAWLSGGLGALGPWFVALVAVVAIRIFWARPTFRGPVKIALDAFRYLGEPGYRPQIQQALDRAIQQARKQTGDDEQFIVTAQGVGTLIALDSIVHSRAWRDTDRVLAVTMGSPLQRYLLRFYPRTLFPESIQDVVDTAAGRLLQFRWLNIYRPRDYVGGALGLAPFAGRDIATNQTGHILNAHDDYWHDIEVRRAFRRGMQDLQPVQALHVPMKDAAHRKPYPMTARTIYRIPRRTRALVGVVASIGVFAGMLAWVATGSGLLAPRLYNSLEALERVVVVDAAATHHRETVERERGLTYVDHWEFEFTDPVGRVASVQVARDAGDAFLDIPHRFDDRALARQIRAECTSAWRPRWRPTLNMDEPCTLEGVRLRYYPGNASFFDLPDYPRARFGSEPIVGWVEATAVAGALSILVLVPGLVGVRMFGMLHG